LHGNDRSAVKVPQGTLGIKTPSHKSTIESFALTCIPRRGQSGGTGAGAASRGQQLRETRPSVNSSPRKVLLVPASRHMHASQSPPFRPNHERDRKSDGVPGAIHKASPKLVAPHRISPLNGHLARSVGAGNAARWQRSLHAHSRGESC